MNDTGPPAPWDRMFAAFAKALRLPPDRLKLLSPFQTWDWPRELPGFISTPRYLFSSTIPQWTANGRYVASGADFTDNYRSLLLALLIGSVGGPPDPGLTSAVERFRDPAYKSRMVDPAVPGFPEVHDWWVETPPEDWVAQVASGGGTPGVVSWTEPRPGQPGALHLTWTFEAWARIALGPAPWYDPRLVKAHANGPFPEGVSGWAEPGFTDHFWGEGGLLPLLQPSLIAGWRPKLEVRASPPLQDAEIAAVLESVFGSRRAEVRALGCEVAESGRRLRVEIEPSLPVIVGVEILKLPG